ncbi:MAG: hypothetical protein NVS2B3_07420 [Vulcanimicrobiaceae bacterium]
MSERSEILRAMAERLIGLRSMRGVSLEEVAHAAGIEPERLADVEAGDVALDERALRRLAGALGVEETALFGGRETPLSYLAGA